MNVTEFDYELPQELIAQTPVEPRDASRLMRLDRYTGAVEHSMFSDLLALVDPGDVLVMNNTRVIPARLQAVKTETGGAAEILLLRQLDERRWRVLVGGKRIVEGTVLQVASSDIQASVVEVLDEAERVVEFSQPVNDLLPALGQTPLPPYIHSVLPNSERYQTVYSREAGSAAAPTAGLHFTADLLLALKQKGVHLAYCTLHIGLDTFKPVKVDRVEDHHIHSEVAQLTAENARIVNEAKLAGGRIIAVGTTSARTLETAAILSAGGDPSTPLVNPDFCPWRPVIAFERETRLFIYPGYQWRVVDALVTNFHLPKSTLLMMVSAFAGREQVLKAYAEAVQESYRFFSFGDAMFIA
jgi:S-adenosylmethionine:tRNA ribosyltransferase-isomerase